MPENPSHSDENLTWIAFKNGDQQAYSHIYEAHFTSLFNYGNKICKDKEFVKDCIHDLFVEIWYSRNQLGNPASLKNYLLKSIRNKIIRKLKTNRYVQEDQATEIDFDIVLSHESQWVRDQQEKETSERLKKAINQLTPRQKEAIYLLYFDNLMYTEIADIMNLQTKTVYNVVNSGLQTLRTRLQKTNILTYLSMFFL